MDDDKAYRLSVCIFNRIALQNYDTIDELYDILDEALSLCFPTGDTHRILLMYEGNIKRLEAGVYYSEVVTDITIFLSTYSSLRYPSLGHPFASPSSKISGKKGQCCDIL